MKTKHIGLILGAIVGIILLGFNAIVLKQTFSVLFVLGILSPMIGYVIAWMINSNKWMSFPIQSGIHNRRDMEYYVYILASKRNGTLYIGVTNNLIKRVWEHKQKLIEAFTKKYGVDKLVYFEQTPDINSAITREKQLKKWNRAWKIRLIEEKNPEWKDLYDEFFA